MDLLGSYGSDAESDASGDEQQPPQSVGRAVLTAPGQRSANVEEPGPSQTTGLGRKGLFAALPPPRGKTDGVPEGEGKRGGGRSLFAALPPPKASSEHPAIGDLQSELSLGGPSKPPMSLPPKKGVVQFRPPIDTSYLTKADDPEEDTWQPPKKKGRTADAAGEAPAETKPSKSSFASFLPPPKNSLGAGNILGGGAAGGRKMAMDTAVAADSLDERLQIQLDSVEELKSNSDGVNGSAAVLENGGSAAAGAEGLRHPPAEPHNQAGYVANPETSYAAAGAGAAPGYEQPGVAYVNQQPYQSGTSYDPYGQAYVAPQYGAGDTWQPDGPPGGGAAAQPVDLLTAKLMEEEARKMRRGGGRMSGPQVVEVKQADITTGTYRREDMLKTSAFGPQAQPVSSAKDAGPGKLERRKHQISSLYADMKKKEMEMMDSRATGMQTKAQTKGKYGW